MASACAASASCSSSRRVFPVISASTPSPYLTISTEQSLAAASCRHRANCRRQPASGGTWLILARDTKRPHLCRRWFALRAEECLRDVGRNNRAQDYDRDQHRVLGLVDIVVREAEQRGDGAEGQAGRHHQRGVPGNAPFVTEGA